MIEILDTHKGERLGVKYTDEERTVARAAVCLYMSQLKAGRVSCEPEVVLEGVELSNEVLGLLDDGLDVVDPRVDKVLRFLYLPYLVRMNNGAPRGLYKDICETLGVTPFELSFNAIVSQQMLGEENVEVEFVQFINTALDD